MTGMSSSLATLEVWAGYFKSEADGKRKIGKQKIVLTTDMGNTVASDLGVRGVILCRVSNVESRKLVS